MGWDVIHYALDVLMGRVDVPLTRASLSPRTRASRRRFKTSCALLPGITSDGFAVPLSCRFWRGCCWNPADTDETAPRGSVRSKPIMVRMLSILMLRNGSSLINLSTTVNLAFRVSGSVCSMSKIASSRIRSSSSSCAQEPHPGQTLLSELSHVRFDSVRSRLHHDVALRLCVSQLVILGLARHSSPTAVLLDVVPNGASRIPSGSCDLSDCRSLRPELRDP